MMMESEHAPPQHENTSDDSVKAENAKLQQELLKLRAELDAVKALQTNDSGRANWRAGKVQQLSNSVTSKLGPISVDRVKQFSDSISTTMFSYMNNTRQSSQPTLEPRPSTEASRASTFAYPQMSQRYPSTISMFASSGVGPPLVTTGERSVTHSSLSSVGNILQKVNRASPMRPRSSSMDTIDTGDASEESLKAAIYDSVLATIPSLVEAISDYDASDDAKIYAADTLRSLAVRESVTGKNARLLMIECEVVPALLDLAQSKITMESAGYTLQCLAANTDPQDPCRVALTESSAVNILKDIVVNSGPPPSMGINRCLACLYNLMLESETIKDSYVDDDAFITELLGMVATNSDYCGKVSARILASLSQSSEARIKALAEKNVLEILASTFANPDSSRELLAHSLTCLRNITSLNKELLGRLLRCRTIVQTLSSFIEIDSMARGLTRLVANLGAAPSATEIRFQKNLKMLVADLRELATQNIDTSFDVAQAQIHHNQQYSYSPTPAPYDETTPSPSSSPPTIKGGKAKEVPATLTMWSKIGQSATRFSKLAAAQRALASNIFARGTQPNDKPEPEPEPTVNNTKVDVVATTSPSASPQRPSKLLAELVEPVLDANDPNEKMLRRVTEQTLRREFKKAGGRCTPTQIADRFQTQLMDPDYGRENRVRFRDVIDRVAYAVQEENNGVLMHMLVLKPEFGGPSKANKSSPLRPNSQEAKHDDDACVVATSTPLSNNTTTTTTTNDNDDSGLGL